MNNLIYKLINKDENTLNKVAFIEKENKITYNDFIEKSLKLGQYLSDKGIKKGDYVSVMINMSIDLYSSLVALWSIGAIPVFFDVSAKKEYIQKCLETIKPQYIIATNKNKFLLSFITPFNKFPKISIETDLTNYKKISIIKDDLSETGAIITFTSGSSGIPKTVLRTHKFLLDQYEIIYQAMHYSNDQIDLGILPIFTLANLGAGITTVIPNSKMNNIAKLNIKNIVHQIETHKISSATISPAVLKNILDYSEINNSNLSSFKKLHIGGGPVFPNNLQILNSEKFKNVEKYIAYGSSEAEPISMIKWEDMMNLYNEIKKGKGLPLGKIINNINLEIIKETKNPIPQISDIEKITSTPGEIIVSGKNVLTSYFNNYGNNENKIKCNDTVWHRTGDIGYIDENQILWMLGNKRSTITINNKKYYPFKIECILNTKYNIERCTVLSNNKELFLILENNDKEKIDKNDKLFLDFNKIIFINKIPMDKRHNAKIDYVKLRKIVKI